MSHIYKSEEGARLVEARYRELRTLADRSRSGEIWVGVGLLLLGVYWLRLLPSAQMTAVK
jgi:hypothetical protein